MTQDQIHIADEFLKYSAKIPHSDTSVADFMHTILRLDYGEDQHRIASTILIRLESEGLIYVPQGNRNSGRITNEGIRAASIGYPSWLIEKEQKGQESHRLLLRPIEAAEKSEKHARNSTIVAAISAVFALVALIISYFQYRDNQNFQEQIDSLKNQLISSRQLPKQEQSPSTQKEEKVEQFANTEKTSPLTKRKPSPPVK